MGSIALSSLSQGLLWAVMAIGVYVTFRILNTADLSAEGTFPLGAAVAASLMAAGWPALPATLIAWGAGMLAGLVAGFVHTKMKIPGLFTGILMLTGLYSVNLRILGRPNIPFIGLETLMQRAAAVTGGRLTAAVAVGLIALTLVIFLFVWFFQTEVGLAIRATGNNQTMAEANAIHIDRMKMIGYMIGNGFIALSGALIAQNNGYADIGMGIGTIVIGLASIIVGEVLFGRRGFVMSLIAVTIGSIVYRLVIDAVLALGVDPQDIKLFSAVMLAVILWLPNRFGTLKGRIRT
ncbi:MAG TPA: ABC transporter permease [Clostridiaceae bacterium]|nr:ABC transporter permease [Clostridiaceae bacterium]